MAEFFAISTFLLVVVSMGYGATVLTKQLDDILSEIRELRAFKPLGACDMPGVITSAEDVMEYRRQATEETGRRKEEIPEDILKRDVPRTVPLSPEAELLRKVLKDYGFKFQGED